MIDLAYFKKPTALDLLLGSLSSSTIRFSDVVGGFWARTPRHRVVRRQGRPHVLKSSFVAPFCPVSSSPGHQFVLSQTFGILVRQPFSRKCDQGLRLPIPSLECCMPLRKTWQHLCSAWVELLVHGYQLKAQRETAALGCGHSSCALHDQSISILIFSARPQYQKYLPAQELQCWWSYLAIWCPWSCGGSGDGTGQAVWCAFCKESKSRNHIGVK